MRPTSCFIRIVVLATALAFAAQPLSGQATLRPVADHHAHLQSLAMWHLFNDPLPTVQLPADLDRVLRDFERGWEAADNKAALSTLFTDDGIFQAADDWAQGPLAIRIALLGRGGSLRLLAQSFEAEGRLGYIAGAYGYYRDSTWVDQGRYVLTLRRTDDEPWRITVARLGDTTPPTTPLADPVSADHLIAQLDSAGMRRGVVLSSAYQFGAAYRKVDDERAKVRAENDWVGQEAARHPDRLVGFCSLNPLKEYALEELERCARHPQLRGLKLHFTTSYVDLHNAEHVERLRAIFRAANAHRFPIVVHMRTMDAAYGARDAEIFLREILPEASDIPVQIAHLSGWGGFDDETDQALEVLAEAVEAGDPRTANLYFDLSAVVFSSQPDSVKQLIVRRIRQIGTQRMLFAVDAGDGAEPAAQEAWENLKLLPLDDAELHTIAENLAPYLR